MAPGSCAIVASPLFFDDLNISTPPIPPSLRLRSPPIENPFARLVKFAHAVSGKKREGMTPLPIVNCVEGRVANGNSVDDTSCTEWDAAIPTFDFAPPCRVGSSGGRSIEPAVNCPWKLQWRTL